MFEKVLNTPLEGILKLLDRLIHTLQSQVYLDHTYLNLLIPKVFKKKTNKKKKKQKHLHFYLPIHLFHLHSYSGYKFSYMKFSKRK